MYNNYQYNEYYKQFLADSKHKIDDMISKKRSEGANNIEIAKIEQQRFLAPLFDMTFGYNERFKNPW